MIRHTYSLTTSNPDAFARLLTAAAGLGPFTVLVTEIQEHMVQKMPEIRSPGRAADEAASPSFTKSQQ
jgi:hypothetical protein